jgi:sigma-B regulation protein RsbU (phosphoserine phosphatase)
MLSFSSLQQRLAVILLLPVSLLLVGMGVAGFVHARRTLLDQWTEATILKLQRAAHHVDMRLSRPKEWMRMFHEVGRQANARAVQKAILDQLRAVEGVARVDLEWTDPRAREAWAAGANGRMGMYMGMNGDWPMMGQWRESVAEVTPPRYDPAVDGETVSLVSELVDTEGHPLGRLEVALRFDFLVDAVVDSGWWQEHQAFLVDRTGRVLTDNLPKHRSQFTETHEHLEEQTLVALRERDSGTVLGEGHPPGRVSGFYRLHEAPWSLVIIAPGDRILGNVVGFRNAYILIGGGFILVILLLIRFAGGRIVSSVRKVSDAAGRVADGEYENPLPVKDRDEIGELTRSFNRMMAHLKERDRLKTSLNLAREVQQNLLPTEGLRRPGLEILGRSVYCDETGGDYYDIVQLPELGNRVAVAVGDVVGHGISAALLMTTVRALLRSRLAGPGNLADVMGDVNRHLCRDTEETGAFMSLFLMTADPDGDEIRWVRAGHDPAWVYDPETDSFELLAGEGMVLGVDPETPYAESRFQGWTPEKRVILATDGIWEAEGPEGTRFGKERLERVIQEAPNKSPEALIQAVFSALRDFRGAVSQADDATLVVAARHPNGESETTA